MLRKLIKHELIATARIMLPIFAAVLLLAIGAHFAAFGTIPAQSGWLVTILLSLFGWSLFAPVIATFVLMIRRFYLNLLRDEGYLTMTLPASVHEHICSKLIVSVLWSAATALVFGAAFMVFFFDIAQFADVFTLLREILQVISQEGLLLHGIGIGFELLALAIVCAAGFCLQFYAAMAIGHSFTSRKGLWSFAAFFGLQFALQSIYVLVANTLGSTDIINLMLEWLESMTVTTTLQSGAELVAPSFAGMHIFLLSSIAILLLQGAVYYAVTAYFLKNRLNLN